MAATPVPLHILLNDLTKYRDCKIRTYGRVVSDRTPLSYPYLAISENESNGNHEIPYLIVDISALYARDEVIISNSSDPPRSVSLSNVWVSPLRGEKIGFIGYLEKRDSRFVLSAILSLESPPTSVQHAWLDVASWRILTNNGRTWKSRNVNLDHRVL